MRGDPADASGGEQRQTFFLVAEVGVVMGVGGVLPCDFAVAGCRAVFCFFGGSFEERIMEKKTYTTRYEGVPSDVLGAIEVPGAPISGRTPTFGWRLERGRVVPKDDTNSEGEVVSGADLGDMTIDEYLNGHCKKPIKLIEKWQKKIVNAMHRVLDDYKKEKGAGFPSVPSAEFGVTGCYLFVIFRLFGDAFVGGGCRSDSGYAGKDVDNLLKPVLDALSRRSKDDRPGIITDDSFVQGVKVVKHPVARKADEKVVIQCLTTKTFRIEKVEPVGGEQLFPGRWKNSMQVITAREIRGDGCEGEDSCLIDNKPGCIFVSNDAKVFRDAIPGYGWTKHNDALRYIADGCVVTTREYGGRTFHWLQKWGGGGDKSGKLAF